MSLNTPNCDLNVTFTRISLVLEPPLIISVPAALLIFLLAGTLNGRNVSSYSSLPVAGRSNLLQVVTATCLSALYTILRAVPTALDSFLAMVNTAHALQ